MASNATIIPQTFGPTVYEALETSDKMLFFQWDLKSDTFKIRENNVRHRYDLPDTFARASTRLAFDGLIHPDDTGMLEYYLHYIYHNRPAQQTNQITARLRLRSNKKPCWLWSEVHLITYYNSCRCPVVAFGNIRNIQTEKLWQERLLRRASADALTGLLSKGSVQMQIRTALRHLNPDKDKATLLIVDADEFKDVNDTFGHLFGDAVLKEVGRAIKQNFRQGDIKGRIGGDEFIVFLPGMGNPEIMARHCAALCRSMTRVLHDKDRCHAFSISVGAAQFPLHGQSYKELFNHADHALYEAKRRGRGQYVLYDKNLPVTADYVSGRKADTLACHNLEPVLDNNNDTTATVQSLKAHIRELENTIHQLEIMLCERGSSWH